MGAPQDKKPIVERNSHCIMGNFKMAANIEEEARVHISADSAAIHNFLKKKIKTSKYPAMFLASIQAVLSRSKQTLES